MDNVELPPQNRQNEVDYWVALGWLSLPNVFFPSYVMKDINYHGQVGRLEETAKRSLVRADYIEVEKAVLRAGKFWDMARGMGCAGLIIMDRIASTHFLELPSTLARVLDQPKAVEFGLMAAGLLYTWSYWRQKQLIPYEDED